MILAAHQPNFIPWLPFFDKMNKCDVFVLLIHCQFEKNGYQNRASVYGNWWTMPVKKGLKEIVNKEYTTGQDLYKLNFEWINTIAQTLDIETAKIRVDFVTEERGTQRLIELCRHYSCDQYMTNPEAMEKYLDEKAMNDAGIEVVPCSFPHKMHVFEAFNEFGIEGTQKMLYREKKKCMA